MKTMPGEGPGGVTDVAAPARVKDHREHIPRLRARGGQVNWNRSREQRDRGTATRSGLVAGKDQRNANDHSAEEPGNKEYARLGQRNQNPKEHD
jgi:hypothetical protein